MFPPDAIAIDRDRPVRTLHDPLVPPPDPATSRATGRVHSAGALRRLLAWPRTRLANLPTPLHRAERWGAALGVAELLVKMDAETGFALGGNKVRKLEYELAPARLSGRTCLITAGGPQSNHCRVTAAFAARHGLRCVLVQQAPEPDAPTGNALLHRLFGAEVRTVPDRDARAPAMAEVARELEAEGEHPLVVPLGASTPLGALGYARAALELVDQLDSAPAAERTLLFVPSSSCGTLAGLVLGLALLGRDDVVPIGVSADAGADEIRERALDIATGAAELLGAGLDPRELALVPIDTQVGGGYGVPTEASRAAIAMAGRQEGIVLDPTYTAKAAAGMTQWIRERGIAPTERVVFLHTGGHPGLLA